MAFTDGAKDQMLGAFTANDVSLHHGDPGADGTANEIDSVATDYERKTVTWNAASGGERTNSNNVVFNIDGGKGDDSKVAYVGLWQEAVFKGSESVTEENFGADGTYTLPENTGITLELADE